MSDRFKTVSEFNLQMIHDKTLEILASSGMWFQSDETCALFKSQGFSVDNHLVYFTEEQINQALKTVPREFNLVARNDQRSLLVGGDNFAFAPSGGSPYIMDADGLVRPSTGEDYRRSLKLTQTLDSIDYNYELVPAGGDIPADQSQLFELVEAIKLTDKPLNCDAVEGIGMLSILFGVSREKMKADLAGGTAYALSCVNPISPLGLSADECHRINEFCLSGVAVAISPMPLAGLTAPCTLPGLLISQNCEIIGTLVLTQLLNPGCPVLYGCVGSIVDMKTISALVGAPETRVIEAASSQLAKFYGLPSRGDVGLSDSNDLDFQAGAESMAQFINAVRSGINLLPGLGALGSWNIASLEKMILDADIADYVKRLLRPMPFTAETMADDLIQRVGPRGSFVSEEHTFRNFRSEFWSPRVFSRAGYAKWAEDGKKNARAMAMERVQEILDNYEKPDLDRSIEKDLHKYYERCLIRGQVSKINHLDGHETTAMA